MRTWIADTATATRELAARWKLPCQPSRRAMITMLVVMQLFFFSWFFTSNYVGTVPSVLFRIGAEDSAPRISQQLQPCGLNLNGRIPVFTQPSNLTEVERQLSDSGIEPGGHWRPTNCFSVNRVAILIPYRNRHDNLVVFLRHMHPFLQKQQLDYEIFVIEQTERAKFNRATLLNAGFVEANRLYNWDCYVLHDVDLLPEDDRILYTCPGAHPRHLVSAHGGKNYQLPYYAYFGGVSAITRSQYLKINGFSNRYFGWGAEDDDMWHRLAFSNYTIERFPPHIGRYTPLSHMPSPAFGDSKELIKTATSRMYQDGLNSLKYRLLKTQPLKLFTWFLVDIDEDEIMGQVRP